EARVATTLRLADVLERTARDEEAQKQLETELSQQPSAESIRERLATLYRTNESYLALAELLAAGREFVSGEAKLARLRESARTFNILCGRPADAISLLEEARQLAPQDRSLQFELADALGAAGRHSDARTILREIIDSFGGRRPKERAPVHY